MKNSKDIIEVFGDITGPALTIVYATSDGDIGFYGYGRLPITNEPLHGVFIKDGTTSAHDWVRFSTPEEAPQVANPAKGN